MKYGHKLFLTALNGYDGSKKRPLDKQSGVSLRFLINKGE
jgi:hypothetical protein